MNMWNEDAYRVLEETARRVERGPWGPTWDGPCVLKIHGEVCRDLGVMMNGRTVRALRMEIYGVGSVGIVGGGVGDWNDAPGRIKEEVAATVRNSKRWL